jgi:type II secretory ATPase GspE/PulE/Tfp pilus assembly ATPase PilB-like protein
MLKGKVNIIQTVNNIFIGAIDKGASDIHIEIAENEIVVRQRIDGELYTVLRTGLEIAESLVSRIKIMSGLETTGIPRPQEGKIRFSHDNREVDLRVSVFPISSGEAVVIRILESLDIFTDFTKMGFLSEQASIIDTEIRRPHGLILVTGANGSGKSTTLFSFLNKLNDPAKSLVTLEDPIERKLAMVRQTQINPDINLTFAEGLKFLLRQDPDIIMVGEIRDKDTANISVQAAITGHLVMSTIHTNNAAGAIVRLLNMGIEPYLLASTVRMVTAQRLARKNCPHCLEEITPPALLLERIKAPKYSKFFKSKGCEICEFKGTKGRIALHEVLKVSKNIDNLIMSSPTDVQIEEAAKREGMLTLRDVALQRINEGIITIEESLRLIE